MFGSLRSLLLNCILTSLTLLYDGKGLVFIFLYFLFRIKSIFRFDFLLA
jgi:hypothetical protein